MPRIVLIVNNVRSALNVGSILRSADAFGVERVYLTGYTPYPVEKNDRRLPHLSARQERQIRKTALGAEKTVSWSHLPAVEALIKKLKGHHYLIVALELTPKAKALADFKPTQNIALIVGSELDGIDKKLLAVADYHLQIPMSGNKESLNVAVASAVALYHLRQVASKK